MLTYRLRIYLHPIHFKCLLLYWLGSYFSVPQSSYGSLLLALHFPKPLYSLCPCRPELRTSAGLKT